MTQVGSEIHEFHKRIHACEHYCTRCGELFTHSEGRQINATALVYEPCPFPKVLRPDGKLARHDAICHKCFHELMQVRLEETKRHLPSEMLLLLGCTDQISAQIELEELTRLKRQADAEYREAVKLNDASKLPPERKTLKEICMDANNGMILPIAQIKQIELDAESLCKHMSDDKLIEHMRDCQAKMEQFRIHMLKAHAEKLQRDWDESIAVSDEDRADFEERKRQNKPKVIAEATVAAKMTKLQKDISKWSAQIQGMNPGLTADECEKRARTMLGV